MLTSRMRTCPDPCFGRRPQADGSSLGPSLLLVKTLVLLREIRGMEPRRFTYPFTPGITLTRLLIYFNGCILVIISLTLSCYKEGVHRKSKNKMFRTVF